MAWRVGADKATPLQPGVRKTVSCAVQIFVTLIGQCVVDPLKEGGPSQQCVTAGRNVVPKLGWAYLVVEVHPAGNAPELPWPGPTRNRQRSTAVLISSGLPHGAQDELMRAFCSKG